MADISYALAAKSDQLNALDLAGAEPVIRIREVRDTKADQQPVWIYFDGDNGKPWKPSKGMLRILAAGWGTNTDAWIGKHVKIYCDPSVRYAGEEVGGVRIRGMSDIKPDGLNIALALSKQKRIPVKIECLKIEAAQYPADRFAKALPLMSEKMQAGEMTLQQIIAQCQKTGALTPEQLIQLEQAAPVDVEDHQHDNEEDEEKF